MLKLTFPSVLETVKDSSLNMRFGLSSPRQVGAKKERQTAYLGSVRARNVDGGLRSVGGRERKVWSSQLLKFSKLRWLEAEPARAPLSFSGAAPRVTCSRARDVTVIHLYARPNRVAILKSANVSKLRKFKMPEIAEGW